MKPPKIDPTDLVGYFFAAAVTFSCARHLLKGGLKEDFAVFKGRTAKDWIALIAGALLCCSFLLAIAVNSDSFFWIFRFSWLDLLIARGVNHQPTNLMLSGSKIPFLGLLFVPLLFLNLPRLAAVEEDNFREGTRDWKDAIPRSLKFGLMHMIVGVPLWCGLALSIPGLWFTYNYFRGGVSRSTMAHAIYNMILASLLFEWVIQSNFRL